MEREFECIFCKDLCVDAVETSCCHQLFCEECSKLLRDCPVCRSTSLNFLASIPIRRIIGNLPASCEYCGQSSTRGELKSHHSKCSAKPSKCQKCTYSGKKEDFPTHIMEAHREEVLAMFTEESKDNKDRDVIGPKINKAQNRARLGTTGKYYCGKRLNGSCRCCNGNCGPTNGCNCVDCMELDIIARALPSGYLVNREGYICKFNGRNVFCETRSCRTRDGQCHSCRTLEEQMTSRYKRILDGFR